MGENREETIERLSAALEEIEGGRSPGGFTGGHGVQSRVFEFRWSEPSLEIDFRLPYDLVFDDEEARKARAAEIGAAIRMAILLLKVVDSGGLGGRVAVSAAARGVFYGIFGENGEAEDSGNDWSRLASRLGDALGCDPREVSIFRP